MVDFQSVTNGGVRKKMRRNGPKNGSPNFQNQTVKKDDEKKAARTKKKTRDK